MPDRGVLRMRSGVESLTERAKWAVFAVGGDDRRRSAYWRVMASLRTREMTARRAAVTQLPPPVVTIQPEMGFVICDDQFGDVGDVVHEVTRHVAGSGLVAKEPEEFGDSVVGLPYESPLIRFALDGSLLATVASYLGMVPILADIQVMRACAIAGPARGSQLFHCDHDDLRQVKVFVLCSAVGVANGPLTLLSAQDSRRVKGSIGYRYGGRSLRVPDERIAALAGTAGSTAFTGVPGRVLLVDTSSCLHFGARLEEGAEDRVMVQFQYLTPPAFSLLFRRRRRPAITDRLEAPTDLERMVLAP